MGVTASETSARWARLVGATVAAGALVAVGAVAWGASTPEPSETPEVVEQQTLPQDAAEDAGKPEDAGPPAWAGPKNDRGQAGEPIACDEARNHGQYVSSVARSTPPGPGKGQAVSAAAQSDCPPGFRDRPDAD